MSALTDLLTEFLALPGMTQQRVATAMDVSQQTIHLVVSGATKRPRFLPELLEYIDANAPALRALERMQDFRGAKKTLVVGSGTVLPFNPRASVQPLKTIDLPETPGAPIRDLPVYASAEGGDGEVIVTYDPIDYVARPARLANIKKAYALYVINDSMIPALKPGFIIEVNPVRPPKPGDYVVLILRDETDELTNERRCLVKELIRRTPERIELRQYNPPRDFHLSMSEVESVHRVSGIEPD